MFKRLFIIFALTIFFLQPKPVRAIYDPSSVPNNRFGIHIIDENDLPDAANLVNSSGGDWGYVTLVITKNDRNQAKWQNTFNRMRRLHLIPLVRIATEVENTNWAKPDKNDITNWITFFNSLNWVIKNRYVIVANEPNHAKEWGGEINPEDYTDYLSTFARKLKESSSDYFILPAGLDASAADQSTKTKHPETMSEITFLTRMLTADPNIFDNIDGWTSHSYPNPAFSGSEKAIGKGTVQTFNWESGYLKSLGITKTLPVFITETGWAHNMNGAYLPDKRQSGYLDTNIIGDKFTYAYENVWRDQNIVAVTPFVLSYLDQPFDNFSWKAKDGNFYSYYYDIQKLGKVTGKPIQITDGQLLYHFMAKIQIGNFIPAGIIIIKNTGQSIWDKNQLDILVDNERAYITRSTFDNLEPGSIGLVFVKIQPSVSYGVLSKNLKIFYDDAQIGHTALFHTVAIKLPSVQIDQFFAKIRSVFVRK